MSLEPIKQTCCSSLKDNSCTKENKNEPCGARFGTAVAAVKDLNVDGFNDVVIGAPLEDDHAGAVYIYHGSGKTIRKEYAQVRHQDFLRASAFHAKWAHLSCSLKLIIYFLNLF
jgi:integrin alpha 1